MSSAPRLRALTAEDLPALVELCREHAAFEKAPWVEFPREERLERCLLTNDSAFCLVVERAGALVGFASASLELSTWDAGHYLHLDCLFLRAPERGRGLGRRLIEALRGFARERGALRIEWQTPAWNRDAVRFYERLGATSAEKLRFRLDA